MVFLFEQGKNENLWKKFFNLKLWYLGQILIHWVKIPISRVEKDSEIIKSGVKGTAVVLTRETPLFEGQNGDTPPQKNHIWKVKHIPVAFKRLF